MELSIIIPIYNVEKYVKQCLDSIIKQQDFHNIEIIVVNDGTPDNSMNIVHQYSQQYLNIQILNQTNQGLSVARNNGLKKAKGRYVWFVDSDDWILENALSIVLKAIKEEETDVYATNMLNFLEFNNSYASEKRIFVNKKVSGKEYMFSMSELGASQRFIFRKEFLISKQIYFTPNILHEDGEFGRRCFYFANSVDIIEQSIYVYRIRTTGSIMSSWKIKSAYDLIKAYKLIANFQKQYVLHSDYKNYQRIHFQILEAIFGFSKNNFDNPSFKQFYKKFKPFIQKQGVLLATNPNNLRTFILGMGYFISPLIFEKTRFKIRFLRKTSNLW